MSAVSSLVMQLGCDVLSVLSCSDRMVDQLNTPRSEVSLAVNELRVRNIVQDKVKRHLKAFHYCDEFCIVDNRSASEAWLNSGSVINCRYNLVTLVDC